MNSSLTSPGSRRPENWAALQALASLTPPSPSPSYSAGALSTLFSLGDIPIELDAGIQRGDDSELDIPISSISPTGMLLVPSRSTGSVCTYGTFGPRHKLNEPTTVLSDHSGDSIESALTVFGYTTPTNQSYQHLSSSLKDGGYYNNNTSTNSRFTISAYMEPSIYAHYEVLPPSGSTRSSPGCSPLYSPILPGGYTGYQRSKSSGHLADDMILDSNRYLSPTYSVSSLSTSVLRPSPPSSPLRSHNSAADLSLRSKRGISTSNSSNLESTNTLCMIQDRSHSLTEHPLPVTLRAVRSTPSIPELPAAINTLPMGTTSSIKIPSSNRSVNPAHPPDSDQHRTKYSFHASLSRKAKIPAVLSWLQDIIVDIWIDQEGFRAVRAKFKFIDCVRASRDGGLDLGNHLATWIAEFKPTRRQSFLFHHGVLDMLPVLRQVSIQGDDGTDYISRQASLSVKNNGVYAVTASESSDRVPSHSHPVSPEQETPRHQDTQKFQWRFEYFVNDRRDSHGKVVTGEKTLTPLGFSCSPGLLHPSNGRKRRFLRMVKKSLVPNLAAERMDAPKPPQAGCRITEPSPKVSNLDVKGKSVDRDDVCEGYEATAGVNHLQYSDHKRSDSSSVDVKVSGGHHRPRHVDRKHRASIASLPQIQASECNGSPPDDTVETLRSDRRRSMTAPAFKLVRHIVPPSELAELLSVTPGPIDGNNNLKAPDEAGITALKPPSHYKPVRETFQKPSTGRRFSWRG